MGNHWRVHSLRAGYLFFPTLIGIFLLVDVFRSSYLSNPKEEARVFTKVNAFFKGSEQRRSLTYYAVAWKHKMAFGIEATKNCSLPQAIGYLTMAVNVMLEEAGIVEELKRNEEFSGLRVKINGYERLIQPKSKILLAPGDRFQILSVDADHSHGWYPSLSGSHLYNGIGEVFSITQSDQLILQKYGKKVAIFHILMKDTLPVQMEGNISGHL